jgi:glutamate N-acetyltransferase/amino-acid N-acetyltransferase
MTTDTVPKEFAVEVPLSGGAVRIGSIAKGSGMIAPNMATMLCFLTTDAALAPADFRPPAPLHGAHLQPHLRGQRHLDQ